MSKRTKKRIFWLGIPVVVAAAGVTWFKFRAKAENTPKPQTVAVTRGNLVLSVSATGAVEPEYFVEIKSKASGEVKRITVQEGDRVSTGTLLVSIDPILEQRRVNQAQAALRMAEASYSAIVHKRRFVEDKLKREEVLAKKGLVSREAVDTLRKELAVHRAEASQAAAQIRRAKEEVSEAKDRLNETEIKAPITGTILERSVQPGQIVASGTNSVSGGTTLLKIADLSRLFVRVEVDEADVAKVKPGQKVRITADALRSKEFGGQVLRVAPQGKVENNVTVFQVLVQADEEGSKTLRPMMTANVEILVARRDNTLLLPVKAVRRSRRSDKGTVVLLDGKRTAVSTGLTDGKSVEILSGVAEGQKVQLPQPGASKKNGNNRSGQPNMRQMRGAMGGRR